MSGSAKPVSYFGKPTSAIGLVGPTPGFTRQIGVLVSILAFARVQVLRCVEAMSREELDFCSIRRRGGTPPCTSVSRRDERSRGHGVEHYVKMLHNAREKTLAELDRRNDQRMEFVEEGRGSNNFAKWVHVAEHESNHNGQFKLLRGRLLKQP